MATRKRSPARPRDAAATRQAILASARKGFARAGYDGVGVREIAAGAGVTAMLVNRYFGSKERLFAEVVASIMGAPEILTPAFVAAGLPSGVMAEGVVEQTRPGATPLDGFQIMMRSASNPSAAEIGREQIEVSYLKLATEALRTTGPHAAERAALMLALVAGVQNMRQMIGLAPLVQAKPKVLAKLLEPLFRSLLNGPRDDTA